MYKIMIRKPQGKKLLGNSSRTQEDTIKFDIGRVGIRV
jgi:hypothetical protein